jgi:hypothetical protein
MEFPFLHLVMYSVVKTRYFCESGGVIEAHLSYEFFWPFVSANLLQILKIDQPFDPNFDA